MIRDKRIAIVHAVLLLFALAIIARAGHVQLRQHAYWLGEAARQQYTASELPASRGDILDASGGPLAKSRVMIKLAVAPRDLRDRRKVYRVLTRSHVPDALARRVLDSTRKWVELPKPFQPSDVSELVGARGVHMTPVGERVYVLSDGIRRIVGRASATGGAVDGVELALDSLLRGTQGSARVLRDARGRRYDTPDGEREPPRSGHTVVLTINRTLQDITDRALAEGMAKSGASGGDVVMMDPWTGEILAMSSRRGGGGGPTLTTLTEPFQPGSTLKPFFAAKLLEWKRANLTEEVATFGGSYRTFGRTLTDEHRAESLTLADVLRFSSNIGIVRFVERLSAREEYEILRDFGFGVPTGVAHSSESPGTLRPPKSWSKQSAASLAIGYELNVTPIQLATAYASLANGGKLMTPALIKEIRRPDGSVLYRHVPRVVRRVTTPVVAAQVRHMLEAVVDSGTAKDARMATFEIAGKSGTARRMVGRHYVAGSYTSSFVELFPARDPQYVILVKIDDPDGAYFGGKIAGPVASRIAEEAFPSRHSSLDASKLAASRITRPSPANDSPAARPVSIASRATDSSAIRDSLARMADTVSAPTEPNADVPFVVSLETPLVEPKHEPRLRMVPEIRGLTLRRAVRALHLAGFQVRVIPGIEGTVPPAGSAVREGTLVRLGASQ